MPKTYSNFEQGDIIIADLPYSDQTGAKRRPALVMSNSEYNRGSKDIVVLKITSKRRESQYCIKMANEDLTGGKLKVESYILADKPVTISKEMVEAKVCRALPKKLAEVKEKTEEFYCL